MKEAFEKYTAAGFKCLPTKKDKSPDVKGTWLGGLTNPDAFNNSFGIGIICGSVSGNLECLDFDNHFGDAKEVLSEFLSNEVKKIYTKYALPIEKTISGGFHLLYRCSTIAGNQKLAQRPKKEADRWRPDTIIETRGEGGYFCADPTPGYKLIRNPESIFNVPVITPEERSVLISTAKSFNTWHEVRKQEFENKDRPGDEYNVRPEAITEMISALQDAGWKELRQGVWMRPGKKEGISATLGKVAPNIFYCFSSNAHPFNENSAYSPFQVIGLLKYNGDFTGFAKELSQRYGNSNEAKGKSHSSYVTTKKTEEERSQVNLDEILNKSFVDLLIPVEKPPVIMRIRDIEGLDVIDKRLFTLGNFSCTTGKSKSKKTFLSSLFLAAAASNGTLQDKLIADLPKNKSGVLLFDTEQSRYDSYVTACRIPKLLGYMPENFGTFDLREYSPVQRCEIIEFALNKLKGTLGFVVIDGIADLSNAINDELEATRVVSLLMNWTKVHDMHIHVVIHENKSNDFATGHLGSAIMKKAEAIISVTKDFNDYHRSSVKCSLIRGTSDFKDWEIIINQDGLPEIDTQKASVLPMDNYFEPERNSF